MRKNKRWVYAKDFKGEPKVTDFELFEEDICPVSDGEVLFEAVYLSVDPYMRVYVQRMGGSTGCTMIGFQIARVVESRHKYYKIGTYVLGNFGWQLYTVCNPDSYITILGQKEEVFILPDFDGLPVSLGLGVLGLLGVAGYFGLLEICNPKSGEVVVVSGAAGAIGSHVGQIAKIKGCYVIGIAGSKDKLDWLKDELHFDGVINYKTQNVAAELKKLAPNGVDCYFDNVGGEISSQVIFQMKKFGRVSVCGAISVYNNDITDIGKATVIQEEIVFNELTMVGFTALRWLHKFQESIKQNLIWIKEGKLKYRETITEGFERIPEAFIGMMRGENIGKAIVKV